MSSPKEVAGRRAADDALVVARREERDEEKRLQVGLDEALAEHDGEEELPERHHEVAAADPAQVEQRVRPRGHEEHAEEPVPLQEVDHPRLHAGDLSWNRKAIRGDE